MKLHVQKINEKRRIVVGTVKAVTPGEESTIVELEGTEWDSDAQKEKTRVLSIEFKNTETAKMAERVDKAKVNAGSIISVDVYEDGEICTGKNFKYSGHWMLKATETRPELNIFHGVVSSLNSYQDGRLSQISMPVNKGKGTEAEWVSLKCWTNENYDLAAKAMETFSGELAKKETGEREKNPTAIFVCYENKPYTDKDGNKRSNYTVKSFTPLS